MRPMTDTAWSPPPGTLVDSSDEQAACPHRGSLGGKGVEPNTGGRVNR